MAKIKLNNQEYKNIVVNKENFRVNESRQYLDLLVTTSFPYSNAVSIVVKNPNLVTVVIDCDAYVNDTDGGETTYRTTFTLEPNGSNSFAVETDTGYGSSSGYVDSHLIAKEQGDTAYYRPTNKRDYF